MEVKRWWQALANAVGAFLEEAAFRIVLAFDVVVGRMPRKIEKRFWNRSLEPPILVDCHDWMDDRRIFSVLVWPPLESSSEDALRHHRARADQIKAVIARGAVELAYSTRLETDYGLSWDHARQVWTTRDGFAYDGRRAQDAT